MWDRAILILTRLFFSASVRPGVHASLGRGIGIHHCYIIIVIIIISMNIHGNTSITAVTRVSGGGGRTSA